MKKVSTIILMAVLALLFFTFESQAQSALGTDYRNSVGLSVDIGDGTGAGVGLKHFFTGNDVVEGNLLFYDQTVSLGAFYEFHKDIPNAAGLKWYIGLGPQVYFVKKNTALDLRLPIGLDYKINNVPLNLSFDWRPDFRLTPHSHFFAARFNLGVRYAF